jgi:hypothetical protein
VGEQALTPRKDAESDWALLIGEGCESKRKTKQERVVCLSGIAVMPRADEIENKAGL